MRIPEIRDELIALGLSLGGSLGARLIYLGEETRRRPPEHRAPARPEPKVTRAQVRQYFAMHPLDSHHDAAHYFRVNTRAISIALRGRRT